jgi:uncharacterized protein (TIGR02594 family)
VTITLYDLAQRYVGIREFSEKGKDHPLIQWWLSLCGFSTDTPDEVPWCSAFVNGMAWELRLPRSKSAAARSWLNVGVVAPVRDATLGDVVVLSRGSNPAQGHVGLFAGWQNGQVQLLGGNQSDGVCVTGFLEERILGVRRLS